MRINNLEDKLDGKIPITREELIYLINSWGRLEEVEFNIGFNDVLKIDKCETTQSEQAELVRKECYTHLL